MATHGGWTVWSNHEPLHARDRAIGDAEFEVGVAVPARRFLQALDHAHRHRRRRPVDASLKSWYTSLYRQTDLSKRLIRASGKVFGPSAFFSQ